MLYLRVETKQNVGNKKILYKVNSVGNNTQSNKRRIRTTQKTKRNK